MSEAKDEAFAKQADIVELLADFRKRVVKGEEVTDEELRDSIERLRRLRDKTAPVAKAKAVKKAVKSMTADQASDLLGDLL
jgi:benzoyl-CoA reductase/2-hydroxyglutaryl-CoA dehydratase subunit BcrC/BadD/HgdB